MHEHLRNAQTLLKILSTVSDPNTRVYRPDANDRVGIVAEAMESLIEVLKDHEKLITALTAQSRHNPD